MSRSFINFRFFSRFASKMLLLAILSFCWPPVHTASANHIHNDAVGRFYTALAPYGNWVHHRTYGDVWYPLNVPVDWRPYTHGYWSHTDPYGWLWVSDWPWGWAAFHYGRWVWDDWYGWIWVPGSIWAPAWVFWSYGDDYAAWAPMPPYFYWSPYISLTIYYFDYPRFVPWFCWVGVRTHDFPHRRHHKRRKFIPLKRNRDILKKTRFFNNMSIIDNHIVNRGIPVKQIEEATGIPLKSVAPRLISEAKEFDQFQRRAGRDEEPVIFRPHDIKPTPEALHKEGRLARQIAERGGWSSPAAIDRKTGTEQDFEPGLPGRLTGKPTPPEYRRLEGPPQSIRLETGEKDRIGIERRQQEETARRLRELEQQIEAEERRMKQESPLRRQEPKKSPPGRRDITIIPWNDGGRQAIEPQPEQMEIPRRREQQGQRGVKIIPWNDGGRQGIEQQREQMQIYRQSPQQGRRQMTIPQQKRGLRQSIDRRQAPMQRTLQPRQQIQPRSRGSSQGVDRPARSFGQPQQRIQIQPRSRGSSQGSSRPAPAQRSGQPHRQIQIQPRSRGGGSRQVIQQQPRSSRGGGGRSMRGLQGQGRNR